MDADVHERAKVGDVGNHAFEYHADLQIADFVDAFGEGGHLNVRAAPDASGMRLQVEANPRLYAAEEILMTGQPDFATIYIRYIPHIKMVESKSLKLYLFSFRNHGDFHEDCVNIIMKDLIALMDPKYIEVFGEFTPRGGIAIHPFANYGKAGTEFEALARKRLFEHDSQ